MPTLRSAEAFSRTFEERRSKPLTPWLTQHRQPTRRELQRLYLALGTLMANQQFATDQRNRIAKVQEKAVLDLLEANNWTKMPSLLLDERGKLPLRCYMHKTRFATATTRPQEVDIAIGLKKSFLMAMECKVTNDETNSIKRINDILKKSHAWQQHWGNFVKTAALLQGVIAEKDVFRLLDANIEVFWSHDLPHFQRWLEEQAAK